MGLIKPRVSDTVGFVNPQRTDRRTTRWTQHRQERREQLLRVARKVIHTDGPEVTMEAIACASGTSKSIVYRYFQDKNELKDALGCAILTRMHTRLAEGVARGDSFEERLHTIVSLYVETASQSINVYRFVIQPSPGLSTFLSSCVELVADIAPEHIAEPTRHAWAYGAVGFVRATFQWWTEAESDMTTDELTTLITTSLLSGVPQ